MKNKQRVDKWMRILFTAAAVISVVTLIGIFLMLAWNGMKAFVDKDFSASFFSSEWNPASYKEPKYGVLSMVVGTFLVTVGAMLIAVPLGVGTAAYLSEVASFRLRNILKPIIELLAAIPSVAVGFIGIVLVGPFIAGVFGLSNGLNALNGSILLAIMSLPTIITVAEDAISAVPNSFKEASYALGANKWLTLVRVTLPSAYSGIIAAIILGIGRALGETMTVLMATGNAAAMPHGFFDPVRTMTATIAIELGEVAFGTTHYYGLFAIGAVLFLISLVINVLAESLAARFRYKY